MTDLLDWLATLLRLLGIAGTAILAWGLLLTVLVGAVALSVHLLPEREPGTSRLDRRDGER